LQHREAAERTGKRSRHAGSAQIPGDVPLELTRGQAEIPERTREPFPGVVAGHQKWGFSAVFHDFERRWLLRCQERSENIPHGQ
jgi:hypothetical protein